MKCPFCAEDIQDAAIICRFCSAVKSGEQWHRVQPDPKKAESKQKKQSKTIRIAGVFFILSAVLELTALQSPVPMFGELRAGSMAVFYHLAYLALFLAMGIGLWVARRWGYQMMFAGTLVYTLDKIRYLFDTPARTQELALHLHGYEDLLGTDGQALALQSMDIAAGVSVLCWWGFLLYIYFNRKLFSGPAD